MTFQHLDTIIAFMVILAGVSLLITTLTQMASTLFALRGSNLLWGIETLLKELAPELKTDAKAIGENVLQNPLITDSTLSRFTTGVLKRWKRATAIRKDELIDVLHMLAQPPAAGQAPPAWQAALAAALDRLDPKATDDLMLAATEIKKLFPDAAKAREVMEQMMTAAEELPRNIQRWFDPMMDRVSQRFIMHTRCWTIGLSTLVAFALHLDALKLLTQLSTDTDLRSSLVDSAAALTNKADQILVTSPGASPVDYVQAMKQLKASFSELARLEEPSGFTDLAGGKAWLSAQLETATIPDKEVWLTRYAERVPQAALRIAADDLLDILNDKLKFQIFPDPYPTPWYNYWSPSWSHFWGILASAVLLSLGAPFWFNMLKTLSNLRPILANKEDEERKKSEQARPEARA